MRGERKEFVRSVAVGLGQKRVAAGCVYGVIFLLLAVNYANSALGRDTPTFRITYHPKIVGGLISEQLAAMDMRKTGVFGERSWLLSIADVNRSKGTSFASFEEWVRAEPGDSLAMSVGRLLRSGVLTQDRQFGSRSR